MAFGSVFWGAMVSLIVPLAVMLSAFFHLFMRFLSRLEAASISLRELERAFRAFSDELLLMTFAFCMIPIALGTTIKVWFHLPRHRWVILLLAPALSLGGFIAGVLSVLILVELLDVNLPHWLDPLLAIPLLVWGVAMLRSSGKLAPSLFMRAVDSESYVRQSVIANQTIRFYRKELRAPVREALRKFVPIPWRGCARGAIIAAFVLLGLALAEFIVFPESISLWHSIMRLESALLLLLVASAVMLHSRNYSITLVSGSTMGSLFRTFWPLVLLGAGFIAVGGFGDIFMEYRSDYLAVTIVVSAFILCLAVILFAAGYLLLMAFILGSRKHRKLWAWLLVTLALLVHLEMHFNRAIIKPREWAEWSHVDYSYVKAPPGFWDVDVHTDYALAGLGLIAVLLLWNSIGILQRLYQNHLLGTTIGQARSQSGES